MYSKNLLNEYVSLRLDECEPSQIQPPKRIEPKEIQNLERVIRVTQQIMPIEVVRNPRYGVDPNAKPYIIANGTRRWRVAGLLGHGVIDAVIVTQVSPNIAWLQRNSGSRPVTGMELFYAWAECVTAVERDEALRAMPSADIRDAIETFVRILGEDLARHYGRQQKFNPAMAKTANRVAHLSGDRAVNAETAIPSSDVLLWMLTHGTKRLVDDVLRHENTNRRIVSQLIACIVRNVGCRWGATAAGQKTLLEVPMHEEPRTPRRKIGQPVTPSLIEAFS